ncbi:copper resistance D family protein [Pseudoduganella sp. UC29_106]|uniref:copper resistance D family protein n=1 Tax=Pseudoduganella sp. UC29_106 TaxID=3374553 RepID=UPI003756ECCA
MSASAQHAGDDMAGDSTRWRLLAAGLLAAFAAARVANSHAAENGLMTASMLIEWTHLVLVCLWLGGVTVAAWIVMPRRAAPADSDAQAPVAYMRRLSGAATIAFGGILATGIYNAWHGLGAPANALGNPYGSALIVKVALVLLAAAMGGYNKLAAFPRAEAGDEEALASARLVLQIESIVLAAAMLAAAVLVAQQPPAMA